MWPMLTGKSGGCGRWRWPSARKSLIALNEMVIRRFWSFPSGWQELSDRALLALIDGPAQPHPESTLEND